jgi:hypothetical protein
MQHQQQQQQAGPSGPGPVASRRRSASAVGGWPRAQSPEAPPTAPTAHFASGRAKVMYSKTAPSTSTDVERQFDY